MFYTKWYINIWWHNMSYYYYLGEYFYRAYEMPYQYCLINGVVHYHEYIWKQAHIENNQSAVKLITTVINELNQFHDN